jgi:hypothetical protein
MTGSIAYASWTKGVGELIDGKDPFAIEFPNFFRCDSAQKTEVILLDGMRSAHVLKLAGGTVVIQQDRGRLG